MYELINNRLSQSQQDVYRLQKIEAMIAELNRELYDREAIMQTAKAKLDKENNDYERLTKRSVSSIIHSVLGNLEERTEKERLEALEAELKYNQCVRDLEDIHYQISKHEAEKSQYKNAQAEYDKCYNEKLQLLMNDNNKTAQEIMELSNRVELSKNNQREIDEALSVGHEVQSSLSDALESLKSAEGWGVWDMFGGGLITDLIKHSHIDNADKAAQYTQSLLRRFRTELADVRISEDIQIDISSFARFADFFFDGFLSDWFMQSKINATQESFHTVYNQVQGVLQKLSELENAERKTQEDLNAQIDKLILEA